MTDCMREELDILRQFLRLEDPECKIGSPHFGSPLCGLGEAEFFRDPLSPLLALEDVDGELRLHEYVQPPSRSHQVAAETRNEIETRQDEQPWPAARVEPVPTLVVTAVQKPVATAVQRRFATAVQKPFATAIKKPVATAVKKPVAAAVKKPVATAEKKPAATAVKTIHVSKPKDISVPMNPALMRDIQEWAENKDKRQIKAVYHQFGINPKEVIRMEGDAAIPDPEEDDHVLLKVQASTVSANDCLLRRAVSFDMLLHPVALPTTPGYDVVGYVVKSGLLVDENEYKYGDRVAALVRTGGNARYVSVPASSLVRVPRSCDSAEAACMISIYTTAYQSLKSVSGKSKTFSLEGKRVLVVGAMDPVGQALVQLCVKAKAEMVYATAPIHRHGYVQAVLGATPLPMEIKGWAKYLDGKMDVVFDGEYENGMRESQDALANHGRLVCFGKRSLLNEKELGIFGAPLHAHFDKWQAGQRSNITNVDIWECFQEDPVVYKRNLQALFQLLKWQKIRPHITRRIGLSEVPDAQLRLEQGEYRGAVVCLPWKRSTAGRFFLGGDKN